jgi:hypothetical protein
MRKSGEVEQMISERLWRARTRDTDQVAINAIEYETEQEDLYNELYTKWVEEYSLSNMGIKSTNTLREATLKKILDVAREREDIDAHLFALILQHMEEDSRDTIEDHIISNYGKPYYIPVNPVTNPKRLVMVGLMMSWTRPRLPDGGPVNMAVIPRMHAFWTSAF